MKLASSRNFVSVLSEDKPVMIFFHHKNQGAESKKIKSTLESIAKDLPLLPIYEYIVDDTPENQLLCDMVEVNTTPALIFFKEGNFHRYKIKSFTAKSIIQFIGSKKVYMPEESMEE